MDEVEIAIIKAREEIDKYAKEAQRLRLAAHDRVCQFCGKVVEDGRWYARECPVDPNGRLTHDWVWCSQPCHISWVVQNQNAQATQPASSHLNFRYR
jgi:type IV secretory pathway protease TraF